MLSVLLAILALASSQPVNLHDDVRPNIIVIMTDDQRWDTIGAIHGLSGDAMPITQGIMTNHGVQFTNAYVTGPLCAPSRASLLTGLYIHNHGVKNNHAPLGGVTVFDDSSTLATWLHAAGYRTGLVGKYMNDYEFISPYIPPGWDEWHSFVKAEYYNYQINDNGAIHTRGSGASDYSTDVFNHKAQTFISGSAALPQPFFLYFAPYAPHLPATPAPRHAGAFSGLLPWRPASYNEANTSDKAPWLQDLSLISGSLQQSVDDGARHQMEAGLAVDEAVGDINNLLQTLGIKNDTIIIFIAGDNGFNWGEHRLAGKGTPYDETTRTNIMIKYPSVTVEASYTGIIQTVDVTATIADYAGASTPTMNGHSLRAILEGTGGFSRDDALAEFWTDTSKESPRSNPPNWQAVRTDRYEYIDYDDPAQGTELYDLLADPLALINQTSNPQYSQQKSDLISRLAALRAQ